jgi:hypothetical protein
LMKSISRPPNITIEQELSTFPENLSSPPVFSGVRVTRSVVLCVCFVLYAKRQIKRIRSAVFHIKELPT